MRFQKEDVFTGLFVAGGLLLSILVMLLILGYGIFERNDYYIIRMEETAGVGKGTPIKIQDYKVGEITELIPIFGTSIHFKAIAKIDRQFTLFRGTKVNITNENVIGDTVLRLYPPAVKEEKLKSGDTLFATNIVNLDKMVASISNMVQNLDGIIEVFGQVAGNSKGDIKMLLVNLNSAMFKVNHILEASQVEIVEIMKNIRRTSETLDNFTADIAKNPWKVLGGKNQNGGRSSTALP